jgi:hypothetical protein
MYKELTKDNQIDEDEKGATAKRGFVLDPSGTISELPAIGSSFSEEFPYLLLKHRRRTLYGGKEGVYYYECDYTTESVEKANARYEELTRTLDISGEMLNVGKTSIDSDAGTKTTNDVYKRIITLSFKIPKIFRSWSTLRAKTIACAGRVNSSNFEGSTPGTVLFCGATSQEFLDSYGIKMWRAEFTFETRYPGWNWVWDDSTSAWIEIKKPRLHEFIDLKQLFTT